MTPIASRNFITNPTFTTQGVARLDRAACHMLCDVATTGVAQMVDRTRDGCERSQIAFLRALVRLKALRKLFLDEAGRNVARTPARVLRHGGEEAGRVVLDAVDIEGVERVWTGLRICTIVVGAMSL